ncbi:hypothetical protein SSP531S_38560 [Streptomyces spongiicola]|uniref:Uncharacterized protein n=1 Tax=Streptomyces spongiicola TaxID=1690221 RepID=A0A388T0G3_9ACTN|nr:hypothetical protein SSP531S_38560 [Streptomyces spongiicola]
MVCGVWVRGVRRGAVPPRAAPGTRRALRGGTGSPGVSSVGRAAGPARVPDPVPEASGSDPVRGRAAVAAGARVRAGAPAPAPGRDPAAAWEAGAPGPVGAQVVRGPAPDRAAGWDARDPAAGWDARGRAAAGS